MVVRARQDVPDETLMLRFQRGEVGAFAELVQRHKMALYNFALRQLKSRTAAEDVLQEVFLRIIQNASDFRHEARFTTWMFAIARNLCIDELRKLASRNQDSFEQLSNGEGVSHHQQITDEHFASSAERGAASSEARYRIIGAIERLPDDQREVFLLREFASLPFREIAELTGTPENTVKSRMRYALERLQEALIEYEQDAQAPR